MKELGLIQIIDLVKWPVVVLITAIVAIWKLKPFLGELIKKTKKISKNGWEFGESNQQTSKRVVTAKELMRKIDNQLLLETETLIKAGLDQIDHGTQEEKEALLLKLLASETLGRFFDQTYNLIFGSQIRALQHLNLSVGVLTNIDELRRFYEEASIVLPEFYKNYPFENWTNFLENAVLILRKNNLVGITIRGQEFLKYLIDRGLSFNKLA